MNHCLHGMYSENLHFTLFLIFLLSHSTLVSTCLLSVTTVMEELNFQMKEHKVTYDLIHTFTTIKGPRTV
jgi:hypothetical protein